MEETRLDEVLENPILDELKQAVEEYFQSKYFADFSKWREEWFRANGEERVNKNG